jgi:hypothetical protein
MHWGGENMVKGKKAVISIKLVPEAVEATNEKIEKEIFYELSNGLPKVPWFKRVKAVIVTSEGAS